MPRRLAAPSFTVLADLHSASPARWGGVPRFSAELFRLLGETVGPAGACSLCLSWFELTAEGALADLLSAPAEEPHAHAAADAARRRSPGRRGHHT
eukprot:5878279-Prymnesium_polylepis.1